MIKAMLACDVNGGIGLQGCIPWPHIERDFRWFMDHTVDGVLVMGRVTWQDSQLHHPIPDRLSYVVTRDSAACEGAHGIIQGNILTEIQALQQSFPEKTIWIIGGSGLISATLPIIEEFYLSRIHGTYECDRFLPMAQLDQWNLRWSEKHPEVTFQILTNPAHEPSF